MTTEIVFETHSLSTDNEAGIAPPHPSRRALTRVQLRRAERRAGRGMRCFLADVATEHESGRIVVIGHGATRWALEHLLEGVPLEELVSAPFEWQVGWLYELTGDTESTASRSEET